MTAAQVMLVAAARIGGPENSPREFTRAEWCVEAYKLDPQRFGIVVGTERYPDTHRASMEFMGGKISSPIVRKYVEKIRPSVYSITTLGRTAAARLLEESKFGKVRGNLGKAKGDLEEHIRKVISAAEKSADFRDWKRDPSLPIVAPANLAFLLSVEFANILQVSTTCNPELRADLADFVTAMRNRFASDSQG